MTTCSPSHCTTWIPARDEVFFRIVQGLFPAAFLEGAEVLLASHDDDLPQAGSTSAPSSMRVSATRDRMPSLRWAAST